MDRSGKWVVEGGYFCLVSKISMFNIDFQTLLVLIYTVLKQCRS